MFVISFFLFSRSVGDPPDGNSTRIDYRDNGDCYEATHKDKIEQKEVIARLLARDE